MHNEKEMFRQTKNYNALIDTSLSHINVQYEVIKI